MRIVSAAFQQAISENCVKITELYILELEDGNTYRYTTHNKAITWDADDNIYNPIPAERNDVSFSTNFEAGGVSLAIANISTDISSDLHNNKLERAALTCKRIRWDASYASDEEFIFFQGFLNVDFNRMVMKLTAKSKFTSLTVQVPKFVYEESCNYNLFDDLCGLTRSDYAYAGTATDGTRLAITDSNRGSVKKAAFDNGDSSNPIERGGVITGNVNNYTAKVVQIVYLTSSTGYIYYVELSNPSDFEDDEILSNGGDSITVNGTPTTDNTFYEMGEIEMTSGNNDGQKRPVALDSSGITYILWPFVSAIETGDTYNLYPGCDLRGVTCKNKFGHDDIFRGFLYVPKKEDTIS